MAIKHPKEIQGHQGFDDMEEYEAEENEFARRYVAVNGQEFTIIATDPFGLWEVKPSKGPVPEMLKGKFTSPIEAEREITRYVATHGKASSNSRREPIRKGIDNGDNSAKLSD